MRSRQTLTGISLSFSLLPKFLMVVLVLLFSRGVINFEAFHGDGEGGVIGEGEFIYN